MPIFTQYVRCLASGTEPDAALHDEMWSNLRGALVQEMKRRSAWSLPPRRLGYDGGSWHASPAAVEDITTDAFVAAILERLQGLAAQLVVRDDVEGLVFRNVRNFLTALQKHRDPIGYRVYERVRDAVRQAIDLGRLHVLGEGEPGKIDNRTLLGFVPGEDCEPPASDVLREHVETWADDLLPDVVTASGARQKEPVFARFAVCFDQLAETLVRCFHFGELTNVLKRSIRGRWFEVVDLEDVPVDPVINDPPAVNEEAVLDCVEERIDLAADAGKTKLYLARLWTFQRTLLYEDTKRPGERRLSKLLEIPRERIAGLVEKLKELFEQCLGESQKVAVRGR